MRRRHLPSIELLCFVFAVATLPVVSEEDLASDERGLLLFKAAVDRRGVVHWGNVTNNSVCNWQGIGCSGSGPRVTIVRLPGVGLFGQIPEKSIGLLTELRVISFRFNRLSGRLPVDLSNCRFMRSIYLENNEFSGPLPSDFTLWPNLVHIDLSTNRFNGSLPSSLSNLTQLKGLYLQNNSLSGPMVPLEIPTLTGFSIAYNQLIGQIPDTPMLRRFNASAFVGNGLCGFPLPACFGEAPVPSVALVVTQPARRKKLSAGAIAGIVIGAVLLLLLLALLCLFLLKKSRSKDRKSLQPHEGRPSERSIDEGTMPKTEVSAATGASQPEQNRLVFFEGTKYAFDLEDLLRASAEVLGKGSVGTAYKAVLENGSVVAVKRLKDVTIDRRDFEQEMAMVGKLRHPHLVPLIAYYYSRDEKLLIHEYMTNGSLSALLHGNKGVNRTPLDWNMRVRVALESAKGIEYLHDHNSTHGNIKSSNILLTNNYTSSVSDHGLAQLVSATPAASRIVGYRAPEVTDLRRMTPKADVYSFGVLLLELLTGKAPTQALSGDEGVDLPRWVQSVVREEWTAEVFDVELMKYQDIEEEMLQTLQIAMACVSPSPDQRPTMKQVVQMLEDLKKPSGTGPFDPSSASATAGVGSAPGAEKSSGKAVT